MATSSKFDGSNGVSAARWLRSLTQVFPMDYSPSQWLMRVGNLLIGDAACWADQHPRVKKMLTSEHIPHATAVDVATFKKALIARFHPVERSGKQLQLLLKQGPDEGLKADYRRAESLMHVMGGVDRSEAPLTDVEESHLRDTVDEFVHGLGDKKLRDKVLLYWHQCTLRGHNHQPGLDEMYKHSKYLSEKSKFAKEALEATSRAPKSSAIRHQSIRMLSSPPELSFSGLFGSSGNSHDSFTRSEYGSHNFGGATFQINNTGITESLSIC